MYALFSSARWDFTTDSRILADTQAALATGPAEFRRSGLIRRGTGDFAAAARDLEEALNISRAPVTVSTSPTPLLIWGCAAPDRGPRRRGS